MAKKPLFPAKPATTDATPAADNIVAIEELLAMKSSAELAEKRLEIEADIAEHEDNIKYLEKFLGDADSFKRFGGSEGAARVAEAEQQLDAAQKKLKRLHGELVRVDEAKEKALAREGREATAKREQAAKDLIGAHVPTVAKWDAAARLLEPLSVELERSAKVLSSYHDVTKVSLGRILSQSALQHALWSNCPTFAKMIGLDRDAALNTMQPLSVAQARFWSSFTPVQIPTVTIEATAGERKPAVDFNDANLGQHGGRALDVIRTGMNEYKPGDVIGGDVIRAWKNLRVLISTGKLELLPAPEPTEEQKLASLLE